MLQPNPSLRITAKDAIEHDYFKDLSEDVKNMYKKWFHCVLIRFHKFNVVDKMILKMNKIQSHWSEVNGFSVGGHACFLERFRKGWMGVAGSGQVFRAGSILDTDDSLWNHFSGIWSNDMSAKNFVGLLIGQDLDHTISVWDGFGSGVCQEREDSLGILDV